MARPALWLFGLALLCAPAAYAQSTAAASVEQRIETVRKAVEQYEAALPDRRLFSEELLAVARLRIEKAQMLLENYQPNQVLLAELKAAETIVPFLGKVRGPLPLQPGLQELAYIAENDRSTQPYLVYVPKNWSPDRPAPLMIFLHGYASYLDKVNWIEMMYSRDFEPLMEKIGGILLMPFGRSNTEFMGVGEVDVLRTIELVRQRCKIDEDRIVISGASMGGSGAYTIACHYPHLFAGIMVIAGRYDYYLWKDLNPERLTGFKRILTDVDYARSLLPNLSHIRTHIFHGEQDMLVQPEQSRGLFKALSQLGFSVTLKEFAGENHWIWGQCLTYEPFAKWLAETRRDPNPRTVEYRTYSLKYNRAYWAAINDVERWGSEASLTAEIREGNTINVTTKNVPSLTLTLNDKLVDRAKPVVVLWNGKQESKSLSAEGAITLVADEGRTAAPLRKTPDLCGPAREVLSKSFLIVYGANGSEEARRANLDRAVEMGRDWTRFSAGRSRVKADVKLTDEEIKANNLVLVGTPADNAVLAKVKDALPIHWDGERYVLSGKGARPVTPEKAAFPTKGTGLLLTYPNPLAPGRYLLVNSGVMWGEHLSVNHKWDFVPDFIIYTQDKDWDDNNKYLGAGFFDVHWRLDDRLIWLGKDEKNAEKREGP